MTGGVFLGGPHVDQIDRRLVAARHHALQGWDVEIADAVFSGQLGGVGFGRSDSRRRRLGKLHAIGAGLELVPGEHPAGGSVLQAVYPGNPHALQDPGADDAARASRAIHDDGRVLVDIPGDVGDAQRQLAPGHAAAAGDAEAPELLGRARIEDDELLALLDARREVLALDLGHVVDHLDLLAEVLARNVHPPLGLESVRDPAVDSAVEHRDLAIAHALQGSRGEPGAPAVVVTHHDGRALEGHRLRRLKLQLPARDQARAGDVATVVLAGLPDVDQGERLLAREQTLECRRCDRACHGSHLRAMRRLKTEPYWKP